MVHLTHSVHAADQYFDFEFTAQRATIFPEFCWEDM